MHLSLNSKMLTRYMTNKNQAKAAPNLKKPKNSAEMKPVIWGYMKTLTFIGNSLS